VIVHEVVKIIIIIIDRIVEIVDRSSESNR
jgi:hypothetical protein